MCEINWHERLLVALTGVGTCHGQQLIYQMSRTFDAKLNLLEGEMNLQWVSFTQCELRLGLEPRDRGAHLMRRIGDEAVLRLNILPQLTQQGIESTDQRLYFSGNFSFCDRTQIIGRARSDCFVDASVAPGRSAGRARRAAAKAAPALSEAR